MPPHTGSPYNPRLAESTIADLVSLPPPRLWPVCLLAILNDAVIMTIAYDAVVPSRTPTRWELPRTIAIATTIGAVGVIATFTLLYLANPGVGSPHISALVSHLLTPSHHRHLCTPLPRQPSAR